MIHPPFKIGIISHNREDNLKTLKYLKQLGFSKDEIILCVNPDEVGRYKYLHDKDASIIASTGTGVPKARNTILDMFPEGTNVLLMDDDVSKISYLVSGKLKGVDTKEMFVKLFASAFSMCNQYGALAFGIYPINNAFFMKKSIDYQNLIVGACMGMIANKNWRFDETYKLKEDYELALRMMKRGLRVLRFNFITLSTVYYAKGGLFESHALYEGEAARRLVKEYPEFVKPHPRQPFTNVCFKKQKRGNE